MNEATHEWRGWAAWSVLVGFALVRLGLAIVDQYPYWPDEVYQTLEPAHRAAFGYGFRAWEFVDGARSWLVPGIFAGLWKVAAAIGVREGLWMVWIAKVLVTLLSVVALYSAMDIAGRRAGRWAAVLAGLALSLLPVLFVTWHRTLSEPLSASVALCAACLVYRAGARRAFLGGLIAGLGVFVRFQGGLFVVLVAFIPLGQRRIRDAAFFVVGAAVAGGLGGALDWVTWGRPFHSFLTYVEFNLVQDGAIFFGVEPWWYYFDRLWASGGPAAALLAVGFVVGLRRAPVLGLTAIVFTALHSWTPHKELRFLIPALALAVVPAALGIWDLWRLVARPLPRPVRLVLGAVSVIGLSGVLGWRAVWLSWEEVGIRPAPPRAAPGDPILFHNRDTNVAVSWVGQRRDVCGVIVRARAPIWTGGYAYLHRNIPFLFRDTGDNRRLANYVIAPDAKEPVGSRTRRVARIGQSVVYRRPGGCDVPDGYEPPIASDRPSVDAIEEARREHLR